MSSEDLNLKEFMLFILFLVALAMGIISIGQILDKGVAVYALIQRTNILAVDVSAIALIGIILSKDYITFSENKKHPKKILLYILTIVALIIGITTIIVISNTEFSSVTTDTVKFWLSILAIGILFVSIAGIIMLTKQKMNTKLTKAIIIVLFILNVLALLVSILGFIQIIETNPSTITLRNRIANLAIGVFSITIAEFGVIFLKEE